MVDANDSDYNIALWIVQRIQGNFERRNVRPASSCASSKNDDSTTTVIKILTLKFLMILLRIMTIMMRMMAIPSQGQEITIFSIPYQTKVLSHFLRNFSGFICYIYWANNATLNLLPCECLGFVFLTLTFGVQ